MTGVGGEAIARGSDGSLWTTGTDTVFKINPATNPVGSTPITVADLSGRDVDAANGFVWVADANAPGRVIRLTNAGVVTPFTTWRHGPGSGRGPGYRRGLSRTRARPQHVGRIQGGVVKKTNRPGDPFGITLGPDGAYWTALFALQPLLARAAHRGRRPDHARHLQRRPAADRRRIRGTRCGSPWSR